MGKRNYKMVKKTLVLGASLNPERYSNVAIKRLVLKNYHVIAVGIKPGRINEINIYNELIVHKNIHTVTI